MAGPRRMAMAVTPANVCSVLVVSILVSLGSVTDVVAQVSPEARVYSDRERLPLELREPNAYLFGHVLSPYAEDVAELDCFSQGEPGERSKAVIQPVLDQSLFSGDEPGSGLSLSFSASEEGYILFEEHAPAEWNQELFLLRRSGHLGGANPPGAFLGNYPFQLTTVARFDIGGEQPPEVLLLRIDPLTWEKMDNWERVGYVTSQAAGIAGMLVFLAEIFD